MKFLFSILSTLILTSCAFMSKESFDIAPGKVIFSYEEAKIQCLSEIDPAGVTYIQLKSLDPFTQVKFETFALIDKRFCVLVFMEISLQNTPFASHIHCQPVFIPLNPIRVETVTLTGDLIYSDAKYKVLMASE